MIPDPLHPAVVHFPIVLAILAPLFAVGALWMIRRGARPTRAWGLTTAVLAALVASAWVATETGEQQEDRVERVVGERPIHTHEEAAELFLYTAAGVLVIAGAGLLRGRAGRVARVAGTIGTIALVGVGWNVGHTGGALVYRYGAASAYTGAPGGAPGREHDEANAAPRRSETAALGATSTAPAPVARLVLARRSSHLEAPMPTTQIEIPESMRAEHEKIHAELVRATKMTGRVGEAARELATLLHPHFVREEQIALPPLGLLAPLSRGEIEPEMREVLPMTDALRAELPRMLREHEAIRAATLRLGEVARAEGDARVARLAEELALHARSEEELFYPAAILVGDVVRARTDSTGTP
ncbi:MAG TPA: DUF2231 domain-containing protein [Gemmatimonadaceae bacterium]